MTVSAREARAIGMADLLRKRRRRLSRRPSHALFRANTTAHPAPGKERTPTIYKRETGGHLSRILLGRRIKTASRWGRGACE